MTGQTLIQVTLALTCVVLIGAEDASTRTEMDDPSVPLRLEIVLDAPTSVPFENLTLKLRISNPNEYSITLRGFTMGYIEPEIHALGSDGEWHRLYYGATDSAWTSKPVSIPAGGSLEHHRFLYVGFDWRRWPVEAGKYQLRASTHLSRARVADDEQRFKIEWTCPVVELVVQPESRRDRVGLDFLRERLLERQEVIRQGGSEPVGVFRAELYSEFLHRYPNVAYAPEIRWELAKLLQDELGNERIPEEEVPRMVELFDECLTFCLDKGGAYAEEFVWWDMNRGGNHAVDLAREYDRFELLKRIVKGLDERYPDDVEAILYRRVIVVAHTQSLEQARVIAKSLADRFPEGKYPKRATSFVDFLERTRKED